ncbi:MAG: cupin [Gammaproteobacteria bacterium]|nr:cupin [Gammaproteobacteria bacterium]
MSELRIYADGSAQLLQRVTDGQTIAASLAAINVTFERWQADRKLDATTSNDDIIAAYRPSVDRLMKQYAFQSVDVISLRPDHPEREMLRNKFLSEHTHSDFEVRFFVDGRGLFFIHDQGKVYGLLCEAGDLISVPAHVRHWFDMGARPDFKCIRLFTTPEGWVANYTGDDIAKRFPRFDDYLASHAA